MKSHRGFPIRYKEPHRRRFRKKLKRRSTLKRRRATVPGAKTKYSPVIAQLRKKMTGRLIGSFREDTNTWIIPIPKSFSLINNPDSAFDVIYTLATIARKPQVRRIYFDHSKCEDMDLGASVILDVVAMEIRKEWRSSRQARAFAGKFPTSPRVKEMFICTGLYSSLGLKVPEESLRNYEIYRLVTGRKARGDQSKGNTDQVKAATGLVEHVTKCLTIAGFKLTPKGEGNIARWAGEIIANAEDHSGTDTWYVIAHMDKTAENVEGECHLCVFGFGSSIYESLAHASTPEYTQRAFKALSERHRTRGFFDALFGGGIYREEDLWTLYALQERVSRFNGREGCFDRGTGTIEMIEAFQSFGGTVEEDRKPMMTLISGDSCILFDGRYHLVEKTSSNGEVHHVIAFNEAGDLDERPDSTCVHGLKSFFPGTVISFKFFVDARHLDGLPEHVAKND